MRWISKNPHLLTFPNNRLLLENLIKASLVEKGKEKMGDVDYILIKKEENPKITDNEVKSHLWLPLGDEDFEDETFTVTITNFKSNDIGDIHAHPEDEIISIFTSSPYFKVPPIEETIKVENGKYIRFKAYTNHGHIFQSTEPCFATAVKPPINVGKKITGKSTGEYYIGQMLVDKDVTLNFPFSKVLEMVLKNEMYINTSDSLKGIVPLTETYVRILGDKILLNKLDILPTTKEIKVEKIDEGLVYLAMLM